MEAQLERTSVQEETDQEDRRFRAELRAQLESCEDGKFDEVLRRLSDESRQKQWDIMVKYNPQLSRRNA